MDEDTLSGLRQQLLKMKVTLEEMKQSSTESGKTVALDQARVGRLSRMDALQVQQMALETDRRRQQQLIHIEGALRRIASGDYGDCFVCGEELDPKRLKADPATTRCTTCKAKQ